MGVPWGLAFKTSLWPPGFRSCMNFPSSEVLLASKKAMFFASFPKRYQDMCTCLSQLRFCSPLQKERRKEKKKLTKKVHDITSGFPLTTSCVHGHWIATRKFSTPYMVWSMETFRSKMSGMYMYIRLRTDNTVGWNIGSMGLERYKKKHQLEISLALERRLRTEVEQLNRSYECKSLYQYELLCGVSQPPAAFYRIAWLISVFRLSCAWWYPFKNRSWIAIRLAVFVKYVSWEWYKCHRLERTSYRINVHRKCQRNKKERPPTCACPRGNTILRVVC